MKPKLPRRLRIMNMVRENYGNVAFTTTPTHVNIMFKYNSDVIAWLVYHAGAKISAYTVTLTHAQFDACYNV